MPVELNNIQLKLSFEREKYCKYIFKKDFGGRLGICYKEPIVKGRLNNEQIKGYTDYGYYLVEIIEIMDEVTNEQ